MPVLPYCIFGNDEQVKLQRSGVRGAKLALSAHAGLNAIYSEHPELGSASKDDVLAFHEVIENVFSQFAVVPFRFPTLLTSKAELEEHLRAHHETYVEDLRRFRDLVQMELLISGLRKQAPKIGVSPGTEYLRSRSQSLDLLESAAAETRRSLGERVVEWRQRAPSAHPAKGEAVRCFALVERAKVPALSRHLRDSIPAGVSVSLSGPWPPTMFMQSTSTEAA